MYIGIDVGGTNIASGLVDDRCRVLSVVKCKTQAENGVEAVLQNMTTSVYQLIEQAGVSLGDIDSIGVGAPGTIDHQTRQIVYSSNIPFDHTPAAQLLEDTFHVPVALENDAKAAALGEVLAGSARGADYAMLVTLGTGIGGGIVINGKIYSGFNTAGGEIGHTVIVHNGRACPCGRRGCWEAYASARALKQLTLEAVQMNPDSLLRRACAGEADRITGKTAFDAAQLGDMTAQKVVDDYISYLACGITNMVNIFQPEVLCIGGGVANQGASLLDPLVKLVERDRYTREGRQTQIRLSELGQDAALIGAAMLFTQRGE